MGVINVLCCFVLFGGFVLIFPFIPLSPLPSEISFPASKQVWVGRSENAHREVVNCFLNGTLAYECRLPFTRDRVIPVVSSPEDTESRFSIVCSLPLRNSPIHMRGSCVFHAKQEEARRPSKDGPEILEILGMIGMLCLVVIIGIFFGMAIQADEICGLKREIARKDKMLKEHEDAKKKEEPPATIHEKEEPAATIRKNEESDAKVGEKQPDEAAPTKRCLLVYDKIQNQTVLVPVSEIPLPFLVACSHRDSFFIKRKGENFSSFSGNFLTPRELIYNGKNIIEILPEHPDYAKIKKQ